jgi:hypothetical protein
MSIQRSKSAPQAIAAIPALHVPRSHSHENVRAQPTRSTLAKPFIAGRPTSLASPSARAHDGDPFSLGNFFPSSRVSDEDYWTWLRTEHAIQEEPEPLAPTAPSMLGLTSDMMAAEAIKNEDKLGVLSISMSDESCPQLCADRAPAMYRIPVLYIQWRRRGASGGGSLVLAVH